MSKKSKPQEELSRLEELLEPDVEDMTKEELAARLSGSGTDVRRLHRRLANRAREIELQYRKQLGSAPPFLREAISQLDPEKLPGKTSAALDKATSWIDGLSRITSLPSQPVVLESYRKGDQELSERDRELLDEERKELLRRAGEPDETE